MKSTIILQLFLFFSFAFVARIFKIVLPKDLKTKRQTPANIYVAYQVICVLNLITVSWLGFYGSFYDMGTTVEDHFYGSSKSARQLLFAMKNYMIWNTIVSLGIAECRTISMLLHHVTCILLAYLGEYPYLQYYAFFYAGLIEISSIPLSIIDLDKAITLNKNRKVVDIAKIWFAASFIIIRIILFTYVNCLFYIDLFTQPALDAYATTFLIGNLGMTSLQYYWFSKIVKQIQKTLK